MVIEDNEVVIKSTLNMISVALRQVLLTHRAAIDRPVQLLRRRRCVPDICEHEETSRGHAQK